MRRSKPMQRTSRSGAGFSLIEVLIVVTIITILLAAAIINLIPIVKTARVDTASSYVLNEIRHTRERAIDERRKYQMTFVINGGPPWATINVFQGNLNAAAVPPATVYTFDSSINLPNDMRFLVPNPKPPAAPDNACAQTNAIDFTSTGGACGASTTITFNPDGSIRDGVGGITNGVVYMGRLTEPNSTRAVSVFGATGRAKGWRMASNGAAWKWSLQ